MVTGGVGGVGGHGEIPSRGFLNPAICQAYLKQPLFDLPEPSETSSDTTTDDSTPQLSPSRSFDLTSPVPTEKQLAVIERMGNKFNEMTEFMGSHPWLSAGMVIAVLLFLATSYLTVSALMGHTTLTLFNAHPQIGAGVAGMTLVSSISLINMCRHAAINDKSTKLIEQSNFEETEDVEKRALRSQAKLNKRHTEFQKNQAKTLEELKAIREALGKYKDSYEQKFKADLETITSSIEILEAQAPLAEPKFEVDLAPIQTESMKENKEIAQSIVKSTESLFSKIATYTLENPAAATLFVIAAGMLALTGVGTILFLHGMTHAYFLGTLTSTTLVPMLIYALTMVYEGHNSYVINQRTQELALSESQTEERRRLHLAQQERVEWVKNKALETIEKQEVDQNKRLWNMKTDIIRGLALINEFKKVCPNLKFDESKALQSLGEVERGALILNPWIAVPNQ